MAPSDNEKPPEPTNAASGLYSPYRQLALQGAAVVAVLSLAWPYFGLRNEPLPWPETAYAIGFAAFIFARLGRQPFLWQLIHAGIAPLIWLIHG